MATSATGLAAGEEEFSAKNFDFRRTGELEATETPVPEFDDPDPIVAPATEGVSRGPELVGASGLGS